MNVMDMFSLKGKTALVTGGAGKYGACIAEGLAEAGAEVVIASRNIKNCEEKAKSMREKGFSAAAGELDIADEESVLKLRDRIASELGGIDILVNNAVARPSAGLPPAKAWAESMRVNAAGLYIITSVFLEEMKKKKSGNIINISSMYGIVSQFPPMYEGTNLKPSETGDYWFHKGGMINYTRFLAGTYTPYNIRANCISPGGFHGKEGKHSEKFLRNYAERVPLGRMANEDDIKGAVVFLASDASGYVTGHNLVVDGGWTIW